MVGSEEKANSADEAGVGTGVDAANGEAGGVVEAPANGSATLEESLFHRAESLAVVPFRTA